MLIISWNANSIAKRFDEVKAIIEQYSPDFLCLQKVRCNKKRERFVIDGYTQLCNEHDFGDWSGVTLYVKNSIGMPLRIPTFELSANGHLQAFRCNFFCLLNTYVPYGNKSVESAVDYRKQWDIEFRSFIKEESNQLPVIICGDLNIVHTELLLSAKP